MSRVLSKTHIEAPTIAPAPNDSHALEQMRPRNAFRADCLKVPAIFSDAETRYTDLPMANPTQPQIKLSNTENYRENYANSVQIRVNVWDFFLVFGTLQQQSENQVEIQNFQGIYLSPQQAKALLGVLQHNVAGYETAFGEIKLDPRMMPGGGPVH